MPLHTEPYVEGTLPNGPIYVDANVLVAFVDDDHANNARATTFVVDALANNVPLWISPLALDEFWNSLRRAWQQQDQQSGVVPDQAQYAARVQTATVDLLALGNVQLVPQPNDQTKQIVDTALDARVRLLLRPRDSFHLATAVVCGAVALVTSDGPLANKVDPNTEMLMLQI